MVDESEQQPVAEATEPLAGTDGGSVQSAAAPRRRRRAASRPAGPPAVEGPVVAGEQTELFGSSSKVDPAEVGTRSTAAEAAEAGSAAELAADGIAASELGQAAETAAEGDSEPAADEIGQGSESEAEGDSEPAADEPGQGTESEAEGDSEPAPDETAPEAEADGGAGQATEAEHDVKADSEPAESAQTAPAVVRRSRRATRGVTTVAFSALPSAELEPLTAIAAAPDVPAITAVFQAPDETKGVRRRRPRGARASAAGQDDSSASTAATDQLADSLEQAPDGSAEEADSAAQPQRTTRNRRSRGKRVQGAESADEAQSESGPVGVDVGSNMDRGTPEDTDVSDRDESTASLDADSDESAESAESGASDERDDDDAPRRRRRRGGRRRRRSGPADDQESEGRGSSSPAQDLPDASDDESTAPDAGSIAGSDADAEPGAEPDDESESDGDAGDSPSARRRRRRRRKAGVAEEMEDLSSEDPPNTVVKVREARRASDEITSLRGSTRIEAKKQRRRDGREAGRRRPPILTEAEFLARRESVNRVMCVREHGDRTQIAVLEDGILVEHYVNRAESSSMVGNVYLGKVQNVLPSMEAAFVDVGRGRNAVLYAGEVNWDAAGMGGQPKRIELALKSGDPVLVQVTKDPIGHKGARLTSQISLPGRFLVYVPEGSMTGISRKLPDTERSRLKGILRDVVPAGAGVIVRTAAEGASEEQLTSDVTRLSAQWKDIAKKAKSASAPALLYGEPDLAIKVVRDIFNEDFTSLLVQGESTWDTLAEYIGWVAPDLAPKMARWAQANDLFAAHRIDEQLAKALDRKVWLPSGGSLVIDRTEAMTVVDVNTGKFTGQGGNLEETVTRNNLEAAEEIVRQLRLRDIGGIIVVDFIDMVLESNRDLVLRRLVECLGRDRTKHQVAEVTSLGLVQMTRKRIGQGLLEVFSTTCEHCAGRGHLVSTEPVGGVETSAEETPGGNRRERGGRRGAGRQAQAAAVLGGRQTGKTPPPPKFDENGHIDHSEDAHPEAGPDDAVHVDESLGEQAAGSGSEDVDPTAGSAAPADTAESIPNSAASADTAASHETANIAAPREQPSLEEAQAAVIQSEALAEGIVELPEGSVDEGASSETSSEDASREVAHSEDAPAQDAPAEGEAIETVASEDAPSADAPDQEIEVAEVVEVAELVEPSLNADPELAGAPTDAPTDALAAPQTEAPEEVSDAV